MAIFTFPILFQDGFPFENWFEFPGGDKYGLVSNCGNFDPTGESDFEH